LSEPGFGGILGFMDFCAHSLSEPGFGGILGFMDVWRSLIVTNPKIPKSTQIQVQTINEL
jgi:hypothetical protein